MQLALQELKTVCCGATGQAAQEVLHCKMFLATCLALNSNKQARGLSRGNLIGGCHKTFQQVAGNMSHYATLEEFVAVL